MADRVIDILTPADTYDLLTIDEYKTMIGVPLADLTTDAQVTEYIHRYSDVIATLCNRVFAYEEVSEIWRCVFNDDCAPMTRLFVSHYPIDTTATLTLETPTGTPLDPSEFIVEKKSGKIELLGNWTEPIKVTYSGGYHLPDEAPYALKEAATLMIREGQVLMTRLQSSGLRSIVHKESRVMFYDPLAALKQMGTLGPLSMAANNLLMHYVRLEV